MNAHDFPLLRASMAPEYAELPEDELARLVRSVYGEATSPEDVEGLFQDIGRGLSRGARAVGRFAGRAAPAVARALPAAASGAMGGATVGGPWGALIGAGVGLTGGLLSQSRNRTARGIGGAVGTAGRLVSTVRGGGAGGALGSLASVGSGALGLTGTGRATAAAMRGARPAQTGGGNANVLMGLLSRPELLQALNAGMMGQFGRRAVSVGGTQVPVHQLLATLGTVAQRAANEAADLDEAAEATPEYALHAQETLGTDAEDAEGRTDALLTLLALSPSIWMQNRPPVSVTVMQPDPYFPGAGGWEDADGETWPEDDWAEDEEAWATLGEDDEDDEDDEWDAWNEEWGEDDIGAWEDDGLVPDWTGSEGAGLRMGAGHA